MTPSTPAFDLRAAVLRTVPHVFETMLSFNVTPAPVATPPEPAPAAPLSGERVSGTIGIAGETVSGAVYLHLSDTLAQRAAAALLGLGSPADADTSAANDVASELANMIGGALKSSLCDAGRPCAMSTPSIVRGQAFAIELPPGLCSETFAFDCGSECLSVDVHLKLD